MDGAGAEGGADAVTSGIPSTVADAAGSGVEPAPAPAVVPLPVPVPLPVLVLPLLVPGSATEPVLGRSGETGGGSGSDPERVVVSTRSGKPAGSPASCGEDPGMRTAIADATGAGPEAEDPSGPRGSRKMRMETADRTRIRLS